MNRRRQKMIPLLPPVMPDERVQRLWAGVTARDRARRRRAFLLRVTGAASLALLLAAGATFLSRPEPHAIVPDPDRLQIPTGAVHEMTLADGTHLDLQDGTHLVRVPSDPASPRFRLLEGSVKARVVPNDARLLRVETTIAEIRTAGGTFALNLAGSPARLDVAVEDGDVVVLRGSLVLARLGPGQRWQSETVDALSSSELPAPSDVPAAPSRSNSAPANRADRLFERADATRLAGKNAEAAQLFDDYRKRYPAAPNAGLAAFEAGRIHLTIGSYRRAAEDFAFAVQHGDVTFKEDSEANLVEALSLAGDARACRSARDAYLEHYPTGVRRSHVSSRCP